MKSGKEKNQIICELKEYQLRLTYQDSNFQFTSIQVHKFYLKQFLSFLNFFIASNALLCINVAFVWVFITTGRVARSGRIVISNSGHCMTSKDSF